MKKFLMLVAVASLMFVSTGCKKKATAGEQVDKAVEGAAKTAEEAKKAAE